MSTGPADLTSMLTPPPQVDATQSVAYRQGTVVAFDKLTLANTVRVGGTDLTDLPILGVGETTMLEPGDVVGLLVVGPMMAILGQLVIPNTAAAGDAISLTSTNTYSVSVDIAETTSTASWHNLPSLGPTITDVRIGPSGRCLVFISATINLLVTSGGGEMSYEISGATTVATNDTPPAYAWYGSPGYAITATHLALQEGLNSGLHTFTAKYLAADLGPGGTARFANRNLTVVAL